MIFCIRVKVNNHGRDEFFNYHKVKKYSITEGMISFTDSKTGLFKSFPVCNCEISEEVDA